MAAAAGVSKTTVSLIVNGRADQVGISLATRQRVTSLVRQMGYVPSSAAREMATGQVAVAVDAAEPAAQEIVPPETPTDPNAIPVPVESENGEAQENEKTIPPDSTNAISANA